MPLTKSCYGALQQANNILSLFLKNNNSVYEHIYQLFYTGSMSSPADPPSRLSVAHICWMKFPLRMMLKHIVVDTAIFLTGTTLSLKVQIWREKPSSLFVFNTASTAVSFLHTVIKLWQRGKCSPVTFSIIKCIYPMSDNVWVVSSVANGIVSGTEWHYARVR